MAKYTVALNISSEICYWITKDQTNKKNMLTPSTETVIFNQSRVNPNCLYIKHKRE